MSIMVAMDTFEEDADTAVQEALEDYRFKIDDLADDLRREIDQIEREYGTDPALYTDSRLWDAVCAFRAALYPLSEAEDAIARFI
jgi:hypothetical protein